MKGIRNLVLLPVLATGLTSNVLAAQPRGVAEYFESTEPPTRAARLAEKAADMEAWLRRLVGRFRIEIPVLPRDTSPNASERMVDCVNIGAGVGVHCIFYSAPPRAAGGKADGALRHGDVLRVTKVIEYGFDPNAGRIRMMIAQDQSVQRTDGRLNGDAVLSITRCWNSAGMPPCQVMQRINAPDDDKDIWIHEQLVAQAIGYRYVLRRMSAEQGAEAEVFIEGARDDRPGNGRPAGGGVRSSGGRPR